ncbi:MAG: glycosyltransferase family 2 protein [Chitinophagaceae bacterium]|nr:glycosyltransferase family 2 protein [Chitinophagaceae bacterium]
MAEISIIVPVYNEAEHILPFYYELRKHVPADYELVWVDDGSTDSTLQEIEELTVKDSRIKCVSLTRNFGQSSAVCAGLDFATAPVIIIMNGNLKNPPSTLPILLSKLDDGYEVVTAISNNTRQVTFIEKGLYNLYYSLLNKLAPHRNINDITRFRAINSRVIEGIHQLKENNLLLSNFFSWSGYKTATVTYDCNKCSRKHKKYTFANLAFETRKTINHLQPGFFKILLYTGFTFSLTALALGVWQVVNGDTANPVAMIITSVLLLAGIFLMVKSKKPQRVQLNKKIKMPAYLIKDVIEQEKNSYNLSF